MMRTKERSVQEAFKMELAETSTGNNNIMERLYARSKTDSIPAEKLKELDNARKEFSRVRDTSIIPLITKVKEQELEKAFALAQLPQF
jgi:hypothetical protein